MYDGLPKDQIFLLNCDRISYRSLMSHPCFTKNLSASKGFGSAREQAHLTSRGHWEAGVTAGKAILNSSPGTEEMSE